MNLSLKISIIIILAIVVAVIVATKKGRPAQVETEPGSPLATTAPVPIPRLVDLGAGKCIPCKMMAPILDGLKKEYDGRLDVEFIDVWINQGAGEKYGIRIIPTQIFFDAAGKELFRHEGFFSKEDILAKWKEMGVDFGKP